MRRLTVMFLLLLVAGINTVICASSAIGAPTDAAGFKRNHIYTPVSQLTGGGLIVEWDQQLQEIRRIPINAEGTTGATFNDRNNLVVITRRADRVRVVEYDASGTAVNEYNTGQGSLLLGSYIDFDPVRKIYAFADGNRVTLLDKDLRFLSSTPSLFRRASGIAFADDGTLYVTDQLDDELFRLDANLVTNLQIYAGGFVPTGIDFDAAGKLLVTYFGDGRLDRFDVSTLNAETVVSGLGYGGISDVLSLPSGQLLTTDDRNRLNIFTSSGMLLSQTPGVGRFGDSLAFLPVPEPSVLAMLAVGLCAGMLHRCRRFRRVLKSRHASEMLASGANVLENNHIGLIPSLPPIGCWTVGIARRNTL